ncbi:MAG: CARDB domain-containing protein, partial [Bacteroidota bacterium]
DTVTFTISVFNQGTLDAREVTVEDYLGAGLNNVDPDWLGQDTFLLGDIAAGGSAMVDIDVEIDAMFQGTSVTNNAEIESAENVLGQDDVDSTPGDQPNFTDPNDDDRDDTNGNDDVDGETLQIGQVFDVAILDTLVGDGMDIEPGDTITFSITVFNQGTLDATDIKVSNFIPSGTSLFMGDTAQVVSTLAAGDDTTYTISVIIDEDYMDTLLVNNAEIVQA